MRIVAFRSKNEGGFVEWHGLVVYLKWAIQSPQNMKNKVVEL